MASIFGLIRKAPTADNRGMVERMRLRLAGGSALAGGTFVQEELNLALGWVFRPGRSPEPLPFWNPSSSAGLLLAGECVADEAGEAALRSASHPYDPSTAGFAMPLYDALGGSFVGRLNGWFHGVLFDLRTKQVTLFIDRYGLQRLYYHRSEEGFYFASEAKVLLSILPRTREFDTRGLGEVISCGSALQNRTLFAGISLLPPAAAWTFHQDGRMEQGSYFSPDVWQTLPKLNSREFYDRLKTIFPRILPRYFRGAGKVGMSLTGGLDGRMIMAWAGRPPGDLPCYSFTGMFREPVDAVLARRVATACRQPHEVIQVGDDFLAEFPRLAPEAVSISDGAMDVTGAVEFFVNRRAAQIAPVRLTGNYGSEIVRCNVAFKPSQFPQGIFHAELDAAVRTAASTYDTEAACHPLSFIAFKQVPWHHYSRLSVEQSLLTLRSPFLDNDLVSLMYQAPEDLATSKLPSLQLIADGNAALSRIPTDRHLFYRNARLVGGLAHLYQEFTFRAEYAYDYGMPPWLARIDHVMAPLHLERLFLGRHKFFHFRVFYRDFLGNFLKEVLLDPRTLNRPYLQRKSVEDLVDSHIRGRANHTREIHRLLTTELTHRCLLEHN